VAPFLPFLDAERRQNMATACTQKRESKVTEFFSLSDRELVHRAGERDELAFTEITMRYRKRLLCTIYRLTGDWNVSEDLVQEVLIRAFKNLKSFNPRFAFSTWVYTIARHTAYDYLKKSKMKTISIDIDPNDENEGRSYFELSDESRSPEKIVEDREMGQVVEEALMDLPSPYREAMYQRHLEWRSYTEISENLGIPIGTVKSYLFRGRKELKRKLSSLVSPLSSYHTTEPERVALAS